MQAGQTLTNLTNTTDRHTPLGSFTVTGETLTETPEPQPDYFLALPCTGRCNPGRFRGVVSVPQPAP